MALLAVGVVFAVVYSMMEPTGRIDEGERGLEQGMYEPAESLPVTLTESR